MNFLPLIRFAVLFSLFIAIGGGIFFDVTFGSEQRFPDVKNADLREKLEYLSQRGIISGYPDGLFRPEQTINRAEALKMIFETLKIQPTKNLRNTFPDVQEREWFAPYVAAAKEKGMIKGYPDGTYKPYRAVNREEFITIAKNALPEVDLEFFTASDRFKPAAPMPRKDAADLIYYIARYTEENRMAREEDFLISDPLTPPKDGPLPEEEVLVVRRPFDSEIHSFLNAYSLVIKDNIRALTRKSDPRELVISRLTDGCEVILMSDEYRSGETAEMVRKKMQEAAVPDYKALDVQKNFFEKIGMKGNAPLYRHHLVFFDPDQNSLYESIQYSAFANDRFHALSLSQNDRSSAADQCQDFLEQVISGFSIE